MRILIKRGCNVVKSWYGPRTGHYATSVHLGSEWHPPASEWSCPEKHVKKKAPKAAVAGASVAPHLAPLETNVFGKLFNIVSHCCLTRYDDGDARQPGWVTIKTQGSAWVVQVKDPDGCCGMQCIGNTLDDALALADLLLGAEDAPWEPDRFLLANKARDGKKKS